MPITTYLDPWRKKINPQGSKYVDFRVYWKGWRVRQLLTKFWMLSKIFFFKSRYISDTSSLHKIKKNTSHIITLLNTRCQIRLGDFFSNFVAFSENPNFNILLCKWHLRYCTQGHILVQYINVPSSLQNKCMCFRTHCNLH